jgi:hypothetical protein
MRRFVNARWCRRRKAAGSGNLTCSLTCVDGFASHAICADGFDAAGGSAKAAALLPLVLCGTASLFAQNSILRGVVTDESGAVVPNATVTLLVSGSAKTATTGGGTSSSRD